MIYSVKCFRKLYKNAWCVNVLIKHFVYLFCELNNSMIGGMTFLKPKPFVTKQIVFRQI